MDGKIKVIITGANGQLGQSFRKISADHEGFEFHFYDSTALDITNGKSVNEEVKKLSPDVLINCAAYTKVDDAEENEETNWNINVIATHNLARICKTNGVLLFHYSSDYVYHSIVGEKLTEESPTTPQGKYAQSKLRSEEVIDASTPYAIIMRTSWVFSEYGNNFLKTMIKLGKKGIDLKVVNDQTGAPTYATDIASVSLKIIEQIVTKEVVIDRPMIVNYAGEGKITWYEFAKYIFKSASIEVNLSGIPAADYPAKAQRPAWSIMDMTKIKETFGIAPRYWKETVNECLDNLENEN